MNTSKKAGSRQKRDERPDKPTRMRETENDQRIVKMVYDYRILSQGQIGELLGKSRSTVQQSLMRLFQHRYLERVFMPVSYFGSSPTLYILDKRGLDLLRRQGIEDFTGIPSKGLSPYFLEHTLAINRFRIAIVKACEKIGWRVFLWKTENEMKADYDRVKVKGEKGKTQTVPIVPDSFFVIEAPNKGFSHFFLELDRGQMQLKRFTSKVVGYVAYYKKGDYEKRYNAKGFRVLTVVDTPGTGRVENLAAQTANVEGVGRRFWFAHLPMLTLDRLLFEPLWTVAGSHTPEALFKNE